MEYQGTPKDLRSKESEMQGIQSIIINGRKEAQKQKLYKLRIDKIEHDMMYAASRIKEVREEISELKEDEIDGDNTQTEIFDLKTELKNTRTKRKRMHIQWADGTDESVRS